MNIASRTYALLLRLLPQHLRDDDMLLTFVDRYADARGRRVRFLMREYAALLRVAIAERNRHDAPRRIGIMDHLSRELRHATRRLLRTPGFTTAALLTLALAIAANVTIFTLVHRVVIAPLPYPAQDRLVQLEHSAPGGGAPLLPGISTGLYREYADVRGIEAMGAYLPEELTLDIGDGPERVAAVSLTHTMSDVLGAAPRIGRWFSAEDGSDATNPVVILSHDFWTTRYGADPDILGRTVRVEGAVHEVIGVMPATFAFPDRRPALLLPMHLDPAQAIAGGFNMMALARISEGVSLHALRTQMNEVVQTMPQRFPEHADIITNILHAAGLTAAPILYRERVTGGVRRTLWVLFGAVSVLLLIAFANLANLFLVRADARQREVAMRRALGAGQAAVAAHHLVEALVLCIAAGLAGIAVAGSALQMISAQSVFALPRLHEVRLDATSFMYALGLSIFAGVLFALLAVLRKARPLYATLQDTSRGTAGRTRMHGRRVLVVAQVTLAVMLLVAAGLMMGSFARLQRVDPGFATADALTFAIMLPPSQYNGREAAARFHYELQDRLRALPGVQSVGITTTLPLGGDGWGDPLAVRGREDAAVNVIVRVRRVTSDVFATLGIPLRAGRLLDETDERDRRNVVVINEATAEAYFPGENPIGRMVREIGGDASDDEWFEVVGVVGNTATHGLDEPVPLPKLYMPLQTARTADTPGLYFPSYVVRTSGPPLALLPGVRGVVREIDPTLAVARAETLQDIRNRAAAGTAFTMLLLIIASLMALLLGMIGVYAVIAYAVAQRTAEIGVRLALGAAPSSVTGMIVRQSAVTIGIGVLLGLAGAAIAGRTLQSLLYGIDARDPLTFAAVAALLFIIGLTASWIPARRAARVSPANSLQG